MRIAFITNVLPTVPATNGSDIGTQIILSAMQRSGADVVVYGYSRAHDVVEPERNIRLLKTLPIEFETAPTSYRIRWVLRALAKNLPVSVAKFQEFDEDGLLGVIGRDGCRAVVFNHAQLAIAFPRIRRRLPHAVIDHNAEFVAAQQLAKTASTLSMRMMYRREAALLRRLEMEVCRAADFSWFVTDDDRKLVMGPGAARAATLPQTFDVYPREVVEQKEWDVGLLGNWNWAPNRAALTWFESEVVPRLPPEITIAVGGDVSIKPSDRIRYLGRVPDSTSFLLKCRCIAIPAVTGTGIQINTLEALSLGAPIVMTARACRGIDMAALPDFVRVTDDPSNFARELQALAAARVDPGKGLDMIRRWTAERQRLLGSAIGRGLDHLYLAGSESAGGVAKFKDEPRRAATSVQPTSELATLRREFLGLQFLDVSERETVEIVRRFSRSPGLKYVVTPNAHDFHLMESGDVSVRVAFETADVILLDSKVLYLFSSLLGLRAPRCVTGADLVGRVLSTAVGPGDHMAILGADPETVIRVRQELPDVKVSHVAIEFGALDDPVKSEKILAEACAVRANYYIFCISGPAQQLLAHRLRESGRCDGIALCTGAALKFFAGTSRRAPLWIRKVGMEWCYRFFQEPRRLFRRYAVHSPKVFLRLLWAAVGDRRISW